MISCRILVGGYLVRVLQTLALDRTHLRVVQELILKQIDVFKDRSVAWRVAGDWGQPNKIATNILSHSNLRVNVQASLASVGHVEAFHNVVQRRLVRVLANTRAERTGQCFGEFGRDNHARVLANADLVRHEQVRIAVVGFHFDFETLRQRESEYTRLARVDLHGKACVDVGDVKVRVETGLVVDAKTRSVVRVQIGLNRIVV